MKDFQSLSELIDRLKKNPRVIGIVRYGSRPPEDMSLGGDFNLFVFFRRQFIGNREPPFLYRLHSC